MAGWAILEPTPLWGSHAAIPVQLDLVIAKDQVTPGCLPFFVFWSLLFLLHFYLGEGEGQITCLLVHRALDSEDPIHTQALTYSEFWAGAESRWNSALPLFIVIIVQPPSHVQFFATPWTAGRQVSLSLTISRSLPKFMLIALVMASTLVARMVKNLALFRRC